MDFYYHYHSNKSKNKNKTPSKNIYIFSFLAGEKMRPNLLHQTANSFELDYDKLINKIKKSVYEKYFDVRTTNMNELTIKHLKEYFQVAEIVSKVFLSYCYVDCGWNITRIHKELSEKWSLNQIEIPRQRLGKFLRNIFDDTLRISNDVKFIVLDVIIEWSFNDPQIYKYVISRMSVDNRINLIKVFHRMGNTFYQYNKDTDNRYKRPTHLGSSKKGRMFIYERKDLKYGDNINEW